MRIKTITAETMAEALAIIRTQLGPEALILNTRKIMRNGKPSLEITAALNDDPPPPRPVPAPAPANLSANHSHNAFPSTPKPPLPTLLSSTLHSHGLPEHLCQPLLTALPGMKAAGFTESESLAMLLGKQLAVKTPTDLLSSAGIHIFIGPHGAGKTTLVAKLGIQARRQGRNVGLLSLDDQKIGGFEPLAIAAEVMGDHAHLVTGAGGLHAAAAELGPRHLLLIDTPGINPFATATLVALQRKLAVLNLPAGTSWATHLVLPANVNAEDMQALPVACHRFSLSSLIFTKLDCTTRYGSVVATAVGSGLPMGLATHAPDMATPPLPLTAQWLAEALTQLPVHPWEFATETNATLAPRL